MFEATQPVGTRDLEVIVGALSRLEAPMDDAERIDRIRLLEAVKAAAAAAQAKEAAAFDVSQTAAQVDGGLIGQDVGKGVAAQVGLAKRESPFRAKRFVGWSQILTTELPGCFAELQAGRTTERRAQIVAQQTAWLSREHRAVVDREMAPRLQRLGDRQTEAQAKELAYRLDPHGYLARLSRVEADRRVT